MQDDVNAWNTGLTSNVTVTNNSTTAINGWSLVFTLPAGQVNTSTWNATHTPTSGQVAARNVNFNATINPNGGAVTGFGLPSHPHRQHRQTNHLHPQRHPLLRQVTIIRGLRRHPAA